MAYSAYKVEEKSYDSDDAMRVLEVVILVWEMEWKYEKTRDSKTQELGPEMRGRMLIL